MPFVAGSARTEIVWNLGTQPWALQRIYTAAVGGVTQAYADQVAASVVFALNAGAIGSVMDSICTQVTCDHVSVQDNSSAGHPKLTSAVGVEGKLAGSLLPKQVSLAFAHKNAAGVNIGRNYLWGYGEGRNDTTGTPFQATIDEGLLFWERLHDSLAGDDHDFAVIKRVSVGVYTADLVSSTFRSPGMTLQGWQTQRRRVDGLDLLSL